MQIVAHFPNPFGGLVWHVRETTSTMDETAKLLTGSLDQESLHGSIVMADFQSAGRGRFEDRIWRGQAHDSLLFTIILRPKPDFPLSLCLGLAVCRYLESHTLRPTIKWPNDILIGDQKLAGILVTGTNRIMQCGIGINLRTSGFQADSGQRAATSLQEHGLNLSAREALENLLPFLFEVLTENSAGLPSEMDKRLWSLNRETTISLGLPQSAALRGIVRGISGSGALRLELPGGMREVFSGE